MDLGTRLRERREYRKLRNSQVALYLGISTAHVSDMESGKSKPSLELLARLTAYYKTSTDYLLGLTDDPRSSDEDTESANLTAEQRQLRQEAIDALSALPPRDQRTALDILRVMRKTEDEDNNGPLVPRIIGDE